MSPAKTVPPLLRSTAVRTYVVTMTMEVGDLWKCQIFGKEIFGNASDLVAELMTSLIQE